MERVRGTCVASEAGAVLLRGRSGSGKSDLALRLIRGGARLVSDDYTAVERREDLLWATAPDEITGLFEVFGIGIVHVDAQHEAIVKVVVDLVENEKVSRMPNPSHVEIQGVRLPLYHIVPFEVSAEAKVRLAMDIANGSIVLVS